MRKLIYILITAALFASCGKGNNNITPPPSVQPPDAAGLIFPDNNAACTTGIVVSDSLNKIPFSWNESKNTTGYKLSVENLLTHSIQIFSASTPGLTVTLSRNTPYSWYVVSKSDKSADTAKSNVWKFYNSGPGIISHSPFPPQLTTPAAGAYLTTTATTTTLTWSCNDVDGDIVGYDVYFGTGTPPSFKSKVVQPSLTVTIAQNTIYYWQVVAKDSKGNTATSAVYEFEVN